MIHMCRFSLAKARLGLGQTPALPRRCLPPQSLRTSRKEHALEARLRALSEQITADVYAYVCTGLFEAHKLLFSFQLAVKVLEGGPSAPDPRLLGFFAKGDLALERRPRPRPAEWVPEQGWQEALALSELAATVKGDDGAWAWPPFAALYGLFACSGSVVAMPPLFSLV
jgi:hypothetical protein